MEAGADAGASLAAVADAGGALAAGDDSGALPPGDDGGDSNTVEAGGTLGSFVLATGGVVAVVSVVVVVVVVSDGAVVIGATGVSTSRSLLHAAMDVAITAALTVVNNLRVDIVCSRRSG